VTWILLAIAVVVVAVGGFVLLKVLKERQASSVEGTMRQFQRGLEALDPENDPLRNARNNGRRGRK
jgi:hypothetical protein